MGKPSLPPTNPRGRRSLFPTDRLVGRACRFWRNRAGWVGLVCRSYSQGAVRCQAVPMQNHYLPPHTASSGTQHPKAAPTPHRAGEFGWDSPLPCWVVDPHLLSRSEGCSGGGGALSWFSSPPCVGTPQRTPVPQSTAPDRYVVPWAHRTDRTSRTPAAI